MDLSDRGHRSGRDSTTLTVLLPDGSTQELPGDLLTFTPGAEHVAEPPRFTIRADDGRGGYYEQTFTLPVEQIPVMGNIPLITSQPEGPVYVGEEWTYLVDAEDPDDHALEFQLSGNTPAENPMTFQPDPIVPNRWIVSWTPQAEGTYDVVISVTDNVDGTRTQSFQITAVRRNLQPDFHSQPDAMVRVGYLWSYLAQATDPDGDRVTYSLDDESLARGLEIDLDSGRIRWTPTEVSSYTGAVIADDGRGGTRTQEFTVTAVNAAPEITSKPTGPAYVGEQWTYTLEAADEDGHDVSLVLVNPQPGAMQLVDGVLSWTPATAGEEIDVEILAKDDYGGEYRQYFTIRSEAVKPANDAPVIRSLPPSPARLDEPYAYHLDAFDPNGDELTYALLEYPAGMRIDENGLVTWLPDAIGDYSVVIEVSDGTNPPAQQPFTLRVAAPVALNEAPDIPSDPPGPAVRDRLYRYLPVGTDPDGDDLTWSLTLPEDMVGPHTFDTTTGLFTWTPAAAGSFSFELTADDGRGGSAEQHFTLTVLENAPPVVTPVSVQTIPVNQAFSYTVDAVDPTATS